MVCLGRFRKCWAVIQTVQFAYRNGVSESHLWCPTACFWLALYRVHWRGGKRLELLRSISVPLLTRSTIRRFVQALPYGRWRFCLFWQSVSRIGHSMSWWIVWLFDTQDRLTRKTPPPQEEKQTNPYMRRTLIGCQLLYPSWSFCPFK